MASATELRLLLSEQWERLGRIEGLLDGMACTGFVSLGLIRSARADVRELSLALRELGLGLDKLADFGYIVSFPLLPPATGGTAR